MNNQMISDKLGPGIWWYTHMKAIKATNDIKINDFINHINFLTDNFWCQSCKKHLHHYINNHPFEELRYLTNENNKRIGMFKWSWMFHNTVNTRIGKPYIDWTTAWSMYEEESFVCSKGCDKAVSDESNSDETDESNSDETDESNSDESLYNNIPLLYRDSMDRKYKLAQAYFMSVGINNI